MPSDPIFGLLKPAVLRQIAAYLKWDPLVSTSPGILLSQISGAECEAWLNTHRDELEQHISWVGTPVFSYAFGNRKSYGEIVGDLAVQVGAPVPSGADIAVAETILLEKLWSDTISRLTYEERAELLAKVEASAAQYGTSVMKEAAGFAALIAAQMSGFGVYMLGSTLLVDCPSEI